MAMRPALLLWLAMAAGAMAADLRFGNERLVAPPRPGFVAGFSREYPVTVTRGDGQFLITWADSRDDNPAFTSQGVPAAAMAIRVDASGRVLDPHPLALPFWSSTTVWTGTDWIILNSRAARISREGEVTAVSDVLFPSLGPLPGGDAAWTGEALVAAVVDWSTAGILVRTFDARFQLIEERRLMTEARGATILGVASDGISAVVAYRRNWYGNEPTRLAVFSRDGHLLTEGTLPAGPTYETIAAGETGYMAIGANPLTRRYEGTLLDLRGEVRASEPVELPSDLAIRFGDNLHWDGSAFTYVRYGSDTDYRIRLVSTRFDARGRVIQQPADLRPGGSTVPESPVMAVMGNTVAMVGRVPVSGGPLGTQELDIRVAPGMTSLFAQPRIEIPPAAAPRETPAAASNGTNVLVAWRERTTALGALEVAATLLRPDGTPVDGSVITLGSGSCHGVAPAMTTNGRDFLVAWTSAHTVLGAIVRADGSRGPAFRIGSSGLCSNGQVSVASNGSQYLAAWASPDTTGRLQVYGVRISSDGAILDALQFRIGYAAKQTEKSTIVRVASNGTDFLVVWDHFAVRVNAAGKLLDNPEPLSLGTGNAHALWFNGRTYVAVVYEAGFYRLYRIGADGSGAHGWSNPTPQSHRVEYQPLPLMPVCDANGCLAMGYQTLLRIEDRGDAFAVTAVESNLDHRRMVRPVLVMGNRLMAVYARSVTEAPYSHAPAILLRAVGAGKQRSVRH